MNDERHKSSSFIAFSCVGVRTLPICSCFISGASTITRLRKGFEETAREGVFGMNRIVISALVILHLTASVWHGGAHAQLAVTLPPEKNIFVYVVILIAPIV